MLINEGSCPLDTQLKDGRTVLHCAAHAVNMTMEYGIIRLLVRAGANMLSPSKSGRTPLDELQLLPEEASAAENYFEIVRCIFLASWAQKISLIQFFR